MASGTINGSKSANNYAQIVWSSVKGTGGSDVTASLYWVPTGSWNFTYRNTYKVTINGSSKTGSGAKQSGSGKKLLLTYTKYVAYSGDKSINISGSIPLSNVYYNSGGYYLGTYTASGTAKLDKVGSVPSSPTVTAPSTQTFSELGGNITISWNRATSYNSSCTYQIRVRINGGSWTDYTTTGSIGSTSTTYKIPAGQGGTYEFAVRAHNDIGYSTWSYSGVVTRNKLNPPTIGTLGTYNPWTDGSLWVPLSGGSQTNGGAFRRCANIHVNGTYTYAGTNEGNGNDHVTIPTNAQNMTNNIGKNAYSSSSIFTVVAWTENGNGTRSSYVSKAFTVNINTDNGATPTVGTPTLSGGLLGHPATVFINGGSVTVSVPSGSTRRAASGTTLSYSISMSGAGTINAQSGTFTNVSSGTKTITVTVKDSRGLTGTSMIQCVVQQWSAPSIVITSCDRIDDSSSAKLIYSMSYSPIYEYPNVGSLGNQINSINAQQYKITAEWLTATSGMTLTGLNTELSYDISVRCSDKVKPTTYSTAAVTVPTIKSLLSLRGHGVGIGCIPATGYALDVTGNARITGTYLAFTQYGSTQKVIEISGGDANGLGIKIGAGGGTTLFSGEAGANITTDTSEYLNLASDGQINLYTNYQTPSQVHRTYISSAGNLYCDKNISCVSLSQTSDLTLKTDITDIANSDEFILSLKPIEFKFVNDEGYHMGFGAQHVKDSCENIFDKDMAIYTTNEEGKLALNYSEFIPPMVAMLQQLYNDVNTIKHNIVKEG